MFNKESIKKVMVINLSRHISLSVFILYVELIISCSCSRVCVSPPNQKRVCQILTMLLIKSMSNQINQVIKLKKKHLMEHKVVQYKKLQTSTEHTIRLSPSEHNLSGVNAN